MSTPDDSSFDEKITTIAIATADAPERKEDGISQLLELVRENLGMDVAFVSEFVDGKRVVRHGCAGDVPSAIKGALAQRGGFSTPLEQTLCQRMMDGRLPRVINDLPTLRQQQTLPDPGFPIGAYLGVPVVFDDGRFYGALCCLTLKPNERFGDQEVKRMQIAARVLARLLGR